MLRWGVFIILLGLAAVIAGSVAQAPGQVSLEWGEYRIDTSVALLAVMTLVLAAVLAILYRAWASIRSMSAGLGRARQERRRRRGYEALSRGLIAVAGGDKDGARQQAKRAQLLLDDQPLTLLLSAQAAQLEGNDVAATRFFAAMQDRTETEFIGLRGLLTQAIKREDWETAIPLARRALQLNPDSEWVVATLYDLQKRTGHWTDAESILDRSQALQLISDTEVARERAELLSRKSSEMAGDEALSFAKRAVRADPGYGPAAERYARLLVEGGSLRKAAGVIEEAWKRAPSPALADIYWRAKRADDALKKVQAAQHLAKENPGHLESRIVLATAALEARLWGEARSALGPIAGNDAPPRVCRLMAELEEAEKGDLAAARTWLMRATAESSRPNAATVVPRSPETPSVQPAT
jgi:HemY protein